MTDPGLTTFIVVAFVFQLVLIVHFALRRWAFPLAMRYGWVVYALSVPALIVSFVLSLRGEAWSFWLAGYLYFTWAIYGYLVEYVRGIEWRSPFRISIGVPYVLLYLATNLFYWFPLGLIARSLWYLFTVHFVISTVLNLSSHRRA